MSNPGSPTELSWLDRIGKLLFREPQDHSDLLDMLEAAKDREVLDEKALEMMEGVLEVSIHQVREIMVPRSSMVVVDRDATLEDLLPKVIESGHSRFPVTGDDRDDIIGILLAKDLLPYTMPSMQDLPRFNIRKLIRPAIFVPESKRQGILLNEFRVNRNHMAIVIDEYGGVSGLVTIEDVLEEIVGEIADEHDVEVQDSNIKQNSNDEFVVRALTPIEAFNDYFECELLDEEVDTIGGIVVRTLGHLPKAGESIEIKGFRFTVLRAGKRRISTLIVNPIATAGDPEG